MAAGTEGALTGGPAAESRTSCSGEMMGVHFHSKRAKKPRVPYRTPKIVAGAMLALIAAFLIAYAASSKPEPSETGGATLADVNSTEGGEAAPPNARLSLGERVEQAKDIHEALGILDTLVQRQLDGVIIDMTDDHDIMWALKARNRIIDDPDVENRIFLETIERYRDSALPEERARVVLATFCIADGAVTQPEKRRVLDEALALYPEGDHPLMHRALAICWNEKSYTTNDHQERAEIYAEVIERFKHSPDNQVLQQVARAMDLLARIFERWSVATPIDDNIIDSFINSDDAYIRRTVSSALSRKIHRFDFAPSIQRAQLDRLQAELKERGADRLVLAVLREKVDLADTKIEKIAVYDEIFALCNSGDETWKRPAAANELYRIAKSLDDAGERLTMYRVIVEMRDDEQIPFFSTEAIEAANSPVKKVLFLSSSRPSHFSRSG